MNNILKFYPAVNRSDLVAPSVSNLLRNLQDQISVEDIWVAEIDPAVAGGKDFCKQYQISENTGANCVIVEGTRNEIRTLAACVALVGCKMNFNGIIKKALNARRVSVAPLSLVLDETQMEYGSITPFGLPSHWPILLDAEILKSDRIIIGSGLVKSKISIPSRILADLPGVLIIEGLASK